MSTIELPTTLGALERLVADGVQESITLDYKSSEALSLKHRDAIATDISAFANSSGGMIVYGVEELSHLAVRLDGGCQDGCITREWLENVIHSNVFPRLPALTIVAIPAGSGHTYYAVHVPQSMVGPHQAPSKRYYKRYNFSSHPMEDYEIADVRSRRQRIERLVDVALEVSEGVFYFVVSNPGTTPAQDIRFTISPTIEWPLQDGTPRAFASGIRHLPPRRRLRYLWDSTDALLDESAGLNLTITVGVEYVHPLAGPMREEFPFDLPDYEGTSPDRGLTEVLSRGLRDLTSAIRDARKAGSWPGPKA